MIHMQRLSRRKFLQLASGIVILGTLGNQSCGKTRQQEEYCDDILRATFRGLESLINHETCLPYDIVSAKTLKPEDRLGPDNPYKSSGLEIGLYLAGLVAQRDLGLIQDVDALKKIGCVLQILENEGANEKITFTARGGQQVTTIMPYKWLDPRTGKRTETREIPAIDNGQLTYSLAVLTEAFKGTGVADQAQKLLNRMDFRLFERENGVMALAYEQGQLKDNIDIWGSEGIVSALLGIVKDGVSPNALPRPSQEPGPAVMTYTMTDGQKIQVIPAYCGSLFVTLFPLLFWGVDPANVHQGVVENARRYVVIHREEGQRLGWDLWGWAPTQDLQGVYREYGVPAVSKFCAPPQQDIVATYASFLALNLQGYTKAKAELQAALANLNRLRQLPEAFNSDRGFADGADPIAKKVTPNILALNKGMEAISLYNYCQRAAGRPSFDTYFWAYLERIGKADTARDLLKERGEEIFKLIGE
jgi:hypothetical protein